MHSGSAMRFDLGKGFFLDGSDNDVEALSAGGIQHKKRKAPVAGDQTESWFWLHRSGQWPVVSG